MEIFNEQLLPVISLSGAFSSRSLFVSWCCTSSL